MDFYNGWYNSYLVINEAQGFKPVKQFVYRWFNCRMGNIQFFRQSFRPLFVQVSQRKRADTKQGSMEPGVSDRFNRFDNNRMVNYEKKTI